MDAQDNTSAKKERRLYKQRKVEMHRRDTRDNTRGLNGKESVEVEKKKRGRQKGNAQDNARRKAERRL